MELYISFPEIAAIPEKKRQAQVRYQIQVEGRNRIRNISKIIGLLPYSVWQWARAYKEKCVEEINHKGRYLCQII